MQVEIDPKRLKAKENRLCTECPLFQDGECKQNPTDYLSQLREQLSAQNQNDLNTLMQVVKENAKEQINQKLPELKTTFTPDSVRIIVAHEIRNFSCEVAQKIYSSPALRN
jgi:hypothetical protein